MNFQYVVQQKKRIPIASLLLNEIYVKQISFEQPIGTVLGKRIVIAATGTTPSSPHPHPVVGVFNTYYNLTEFLWEEASGVPEVTKGVEVDIINEQSN